MATRPKKNGRTLSVNTKEFFIRPHDSGLEEIDLQTGMVTRWFFGGASRKESRRHSGKKSLLWRRR